MRFEPYVGWRSQQLRLVERPPRFGITLALLSNTARMARLKDFPWWPKAWTDEKGGSPATAAELRKGGVLRIARLLHGSLTLEADHNGTVYTANIDSNLSEDFLLLLRHILLQHLGQPMDVVENIDIGFNHLT